MAIAYPRPMPSFGLGSQRFEIQRVDFVSPRIGGRLNAVTAGFPLWIAEWTLAAMSEEGANEWRAWVSSLRGSQRRFFGGDQFADLPRDYRAGGLGGFSGAASSWSVNADRDVLSLSGMPADRKLSPGDYVGFRWAAGSRRTMVRVLEVGAGAAPSVAIEPPLPALVPSMAVAHIDAPSCLMRLRSETELGEMDVERVLSGRISAVQDLVV